MKCVNVLVKVTCCGECPNLYKGHMNDYCNLLDVIVNDAVDEGYIDDRCPLLEKNKTDHAKGVESEH